MTRKATLDRCARFLCMLGWHGKSEDRVLKEYPSGCKILADFCSRCGHCYVKITPEMWKILK